MLLVERCHGMLIQHRYWRRCHVTVKFLFMWPEGISSHIASSLLTCLMQEALFRYTIPASTVLGLLKKDYIHAAEEYNSPCGNWYFQDVTIDGIW